MNLRERLALRRMVREDLVDMVQAGGTKDEIREAMQEKYGALDWEIILKLIVELLPVILALFKK